MPPLFATIVFGFAIWGLFFLGRDRKARVSKALWIPVIWLSISGSRMVSQWLSATALYKAHPSLNAVEQPLDGSPFDRNLLLCLIALAVIVLIERRHLVIRVVRANGPILLFLLYCAASIVWSDYPSVAFKRWTKAIGDLAMVLIVVTDANPMAAVKRLLTRTGFLLLPISILLIKYFPHIAVGYRSYSSFPTYMGVTTSKTELGGISLLFGIASAWQFVECLQDKRDPRRTQRLAAHGALVVMSLFLIWRANTVTALMCFLMAGSLIAATSFSRFARKPSVVHLMVVGMLCVSFTALFLGVGAGLVELVGRDSTLTGRTGVWHLILGMAPNHLLGTGFESFWLGPRLAKIYHVYWWHPNEAHNGYIEVFLDLGWVGLAFLGLVLVTGYRNVIRAFRQDRDAGRLRLAYFVVAVVYNFTESATRIMHPVWILFLLAIVAVPGGWVQRKAKKKTVDRPAFSALPPCLEEV